LSYPSGDALGTGAVLPSGEALGTGAVLGVFSCFFFVVSENIAIFAVRGMG